jgi:hypothetical protein
MKRSPFSRIDQPELVTQSSIQLRGTLLAGGDDWTVTRPDGVIQPHEQGCDPTGSEDQKIAQS